MTKLYRAHIVEYPEFEEYLAVDNPGTEYAEESWEWRPVGWEADAHYIEKFRTTKWLEPDTNKWFRSRSSAKRRVDLLEAAGYRAVVQQSAPVVWPAGDATRVEPASDRQRARAAIRTLIELGIVDSADHLLGI